MKTYWLTLALSEEEVEERLERLKEAGMLRAETPEVIAMIRDFGEIVSLKEEEG